MSKIKLITILSIFSFALYAFSFSMQYDQQQGLASVLSVGHIKQVKKVKRIIKSDHHFTHNELKQLNQNYSISNNHNIINLIRKDLKGIDMRFETSR